MTRKADQLIAAGRYAEALVELHALRQTGPSDERIDFAMGIALLRRGETDRAEPHLERYRERAHDARQQAEALAALGEIYRQRAEIERATTAFERALDVLTDDDEPRARCMIGLAALACARGDIAEGRQFANEAAESDATPSAHVAAHLTLASCHRVAGDVVMAERAARTAINLAARLPRELANSYIAYAQLVGDARGALDGIALDASAAMLARAQELLREHGSLADLERIREAFQRYGRRATDRVSPNHMRTVVDELRRARAAISRDAHQFVELVHASAPQLTPDAVETERAIDETLQTMSDAEGRALAATQAVISERETIRILLDFVRTLNQVNDKRRLLAESCKMAAQLAGADRALVALTNASGVLEVRDSLHIAELEDVQRPGSSAPREPLARPSSMDLSRTSSMDLSRPSSARLTPWPDVSQRGAPDMDPHADTPWRRALDLVIETRKPTLVGSEEAHARGDENLRVGTAIVVPLRVGNHVIGALYLDNELGGGLFTSQHLDLLALFAAHISTMLQNVRTTDELRFAARSRAATLDAISDGVLWLDRQGVTTAINRVAAEILGVAPNAMPKLVALPGLSFIEPTLDRGEPVDDRVTRIGAHEVIVNARVVRGDDHEVVGVVVTLTGMKRAKSMAQRIAGSPARYSFRDLIGKSPSLTGRLRVAEAAARSDANVLVLGESGTGKELVAQAIHNASSRAAGPFVGINCSAIPRELLESELFGYEGGAFTGARRGGQPGKFELAEGGTILLDEIGDMPLEMQAKLLRVLQERRVRRIGGAREIVLDARVIASTHQNLDAAAAQGRFRADLLFRLKVIEIIVPPLRERTGDVPLLAEHFMKLFAARLGKKLRSIAPHVMDALQSYAWPGNIRELENVLESAISLLDDDETILGHVPDAIIRASARAPERASARTLEDAERQLLVDTLARHGGSISDAAKELGISRGTVYNKLTAFGIDLKTFRGRS